MLKVNKCQQGIIPADEEKSKWEKSGDQARCGKLSVKREAGDCPRGP